MSEPVRAATARRLTVRLEQDAADRAAVQHLRWRIFFEEMGAAATDTAGTVDADAYDALCDHLLVIDEDAPAADCVVGTYRLLRESIARAHERFYSAGEFDLSTLTEGPAPLANCSNWAGPACWPVTLPGMTSARCSAALRSRGPIRRPTRRGCRTFTTTIWPMRSGAPGCRTFRRCRWRNWRAGLIPTCIDQDPCAHWRRRCCQSNRNSPPIGARGPNVANPQAASHCHTARAAERRSL